MDFSIWISEDGINVWQIIRTLIQIAAVGCIVAGVVVFYKKKNHVFGDRVLAAVLPISVLGAVIAFIIGILTGVGTWWTPHRLAKVVGIAQGIDLYPLPGFGRISTSFYGPIAELAYLPTVLSRDPLWMSLIGSCLSVAMMLTPIIMLFYLYKNTITTFSMMVYSLLIFYVLYTVFDYALAHVSFMVHADAPAISLTLLSVYFLVRANYTNSRKASIIISGVLIALAPFAKQTFSFAVIALIFSAYFLLNRSFIRYFATGIVVGIILGVASIGYVSSFNGYIYNTIIRLSGHGYDKSLLLTIRGLYDSIVLFIAPIVLSILVLHKTKNQTGFEARNIEFVLLAVIVFMLPISVMSAMKAGADRNNYGIIIAATAIVGLLGLLRLSSFFSAISNSIEEQYKDAVLSIVNVVTAVGLVIMSTHFLFFSQSSFVAGEVQSLRNYGERAAYRYLSESDKSVYMPLNRLSQVLIDKRLYHGAFEIWEMIEAGVHIDSTTFFKGAPLNPDIITIPRQTWPPNSRYGIPVILRFYPDYVVSNDTTGDAYWIEYRPRAVVDSVRVE